MVNLGSQQTDFHDPGNAVAPGDPSGAAGDDPPPWGPDSWPGWPPAGGADWTIDASWDGDAAWGGSAGWGVATPSAATQSAVAGSQTAAPPPAVASAIQPAMPVAGPGGLSGATTPTVAAVSVATLADQAVAEGGLTSPASGAATDTVGTGGSTALLASALSSAYGLTGAGIKVGVISDSFNDLGGAAADEADGALPSNVTVLQDDPYGNGTDEGRAMLELVHQIAPGAQLYFATGEGGDQNFADNIEALQAAGCNIIIDDLNYADEPMFQEGVISQAIDNVTADGVLYLTAAGNNASNAYQSSWSALTPQTVTIGADSEITFDLQWNQPFEDPTTSLGMTFTDAFGAHITATEEDGVDYEGDAVTLLGLENTSSSAITGTISISDLSGPAPGLVKLVALGDGAPVSIADANTGTLFGHAEDPNAITVAAAYSGNDELESYTSSGTGAEWLFNSNGSAIPGGETLDKVNLTGVDGIETTLSGDLSDFFGTSAATPTVAAVAALLMQFEPTLSPSQIEETLENTATSLGEPAVLQGAGLVNALAAAESLAPRNPAPPGGTTADMVLSNDGSYEIYDLGNNSIMAAYALGQIQSDYQIAGLGTFDGSDASDLMVRNATSGNFEIYDVNNNDITGSVSLGAVGLNWQVAGFGETNPNDSTGMMLRNSTSGDFELYGIQNNQIVSATSIGAVGLDWQVAGFGRFDGDDTTDMLLRNTTSGDFEVYDVVNNALTSATSLGAVGLEWQVAGVGNFYGNGTTDMMLRNSSTGEFEVYDISNNQILSASAIGAVGFEWQVVAFAPVDGAGSSDMVLRDTNTGAFEVYDIANGQLASAKSLGQVGGAWQVGGLAASSSASQLAQAMASFSPGNSASTANLASQASADPASALIAAANPVQHVSMATS